MSATIIPPTIGVATTRTTRSRRIPATLLALAPAVLALLVAAPAPASASAALGPPPARPPAAAAPAARAPVTAVPVTRATGGGSHTVRPGETLSGIALQYGTSVSALAAANGLADPDVVRDGTSLTIPTGSSAATGTPSAGAAPVPAGGGGAGTGALPERLQGSPSRQALIPVFDRWANANGVPADLLKAMTWLESGWQNDVVSHTNAVGIGQLMPDTVDFMEQLIGADLDAAVPEDNIRMSARYLRWLLARYGTASDALAAYYQGPSSVERNGTFDETDTYVANVLALRARF